MTPEHEDPMLDACLDEVLGGAAPPDLTERILAAFAQINQTTNAGGAAAVRGKVQADGAGLHSLPPPFPTHANRPIPLPQSASPVAPPVQHAGLTPANRAAVRSKRRQMPAVPVALAACAAVVLAVVGVFAFREQLFSAKSEIAGAKGTEKPASVQPRTPSGSAPQAAPVKPENSSAVVQNSAPSAPAAKEEPLPEIPAVPRVAVSEQAPVEPAPAEPAPTAPATSPAPASPAAVAKAPPASDAEVVAFINDQLAAAWKVAGVKGVEKATDAEWCRRAYLRLIGRIPTVDELQKFVATKSPQKRAALVDQLTSASGTADEYARHWGDVFTNLLIGRANGAKPEEAAQRQQLQDYLAAQFHQNRPYNSVVHDLIAATGSNDPHAADFNPAVNFLLANAGEKDTLATARTSRVFLGTQLQCVQCHNHPLGSMVTQNQFWEMNAFFRQMQVERRGNTGFARLVNVDFAGEGKQADGHAEIYYEQANGHMKVAYPVFLDGAAIARSGAVAQVDRRQELAKFVAQSDHLSQTLVNRLWAAFLGYGFTRPVDDLGPHNPPSHPELMSRLARQFEAHNYDTRALMRWIALSDAFAATSKITPANRADDPAASGSALFARYYTRQLQAEEVYQSLMIAAARPAGATAPTGEMARQVWLGQFAQNMNTDEGDEQHTFNGALPQSLAMMNGELMQRATSAEPGSMLHQIVQAKLTPAEKVDHLFQAALARKPTRKEAEAAQKLIVSREGDMATALADLWWALLNSGEFILDH